MNLEKILPVIEPEKAICKFTDCSMRGYFMKCHLHNYILCERFIEYINDLNEEQREILFRPDEFYLG